VRKTADQQRRWSRAAVQCGGVDGAGGAAGMGWRWWVVVQVDGGGGRNPRLSARADAGWCFRSTAVGSSYAGRR
jgi:hypothetical protein